MNNNCPKCKTFLREDTAVKVTETNNIKIIGYYKFCPNMNCDFETDVYKKGYEGLGQELER